MWLRAEATGGSNSLGKVLAKPAIYAPLGASTKDPSSRARTGLRVKSVVVYFLESRESGPRRIPKTDRDAP